MRKVALLIVAMALAACGDPATIDERGYTKAPLETPGLIIEAEPTPALDGIRGRLVPGLEGTLPDALGG